MYSRKGFRIVVCFLMVVFFHAGISSRRCARSAVMLGCLSRETPPLFATCKVSSYIISPVFCFYCPCMMRLSFPFIFLGVENVENWFRQLATDFVGLQLIMVVLPGKTPVYGESRLTVKTENCLLNTVVFFA